MLVHAIVENENVAAFLVGELPFTPVKFVAIESLKDKVLEPWNKVL